MSYSHAARIKECNSYFPFGLNLSKAPNCPFGLSLSKAILRMRRGQRPKV